MPLTKEEKAKLWQAIDSLKLKITGPWNQKLVIISRNDTIDEVLEIIDDMPKTNTDLLLAFKDKVKAWWDDVYPEDIFPVENEDIPKENRDEGAKRVAEIRELIKKIESEDRNE